MGALRGGEHDVDGGEDARAVRLERVEGAGGGEAFQHPLVDGARIDPAGEIAEVREPLIARLDDRFDGGTADAFDGGERIPDGGAGDVELDARAIDRGRLDRDAEAARNSTG